MKISIHFSLAPAKTPELPIRMRISYDGLRLDLRTGFVCPVDKWDEQMMRVRPGAVNRYGQKAQAINRALSKEETVLMDILARYDLDGKVPEPAVLKADFEQAMGRKPSKSKRAAQAGGDTCTVSSVFRRFMKEYCTVESLSSRTTQGYETVLAHVVDFPFSEADVNELSMSDLSDFVVELRDLGLENSSVQLYLSKFKSVLKWARKQGLYRGTLPEDFQPRLKTSRMNDVHYLEWHEFMQMLEVPLIDYKLSSVRDAFCFSCATGLRVSDCSQLRWSDIDFDGDVPRLSVVVKKTKKPVSIELNKWSKMILERQPSYASRDGLVFDSFLIAYRNIKLSVIARMAGIVGQVRELSYVGNQCTVSMVNKADAITTHWARHTFVVHALNLGIQPDVIMAWTGHSSYQTMKPYIAITDKTKAEKMKLFDE